MFFCYFWIKQNRIILWHINTINLIYGFVILYLYDKYIFSLFLFQKLVEFCYLLIFFFLSKMIIVQNIFSNKHIIGTMMLWKNSLKTTFSSVAVCQCCAKRWRFGHVFSLASYVTSKWKVIQYFRNWFSW